MIRFTKAKPKAKVKAKPKGSKKATLNKLKAFLAAAEPEAIEFLVSFWNTQAKGVTYKELREAYLVGGITEKQFTKWQKDYSKMVDSILAPKWQQEADLAAAQAKAQYPHFFYEPSVSAGMDFIKQHGAELVTNLAQEQKDALNAIILHVSGYTAITPDEASRIMRPIIGLTKPQAIANARYRESVKQAYLKAHPHGKPETAEKKATEAAARYAARQHRYRAQCIARTELAYGYNAGAYGATKDAQAQGYIGDCMKVWLTAYDERVCPICSQMDEEKRNIDELFSNGKLLPPGHPQCRCAVAYEEIEGTNFNPALTEQPEEDIIEIDSGLEQTQPLTIEQVKQVMTAQVQALPEEQKQALQNYTGFAATQINIAIRRNRVTPEIQQKIDLLDAALKDGTVPETVVLHRDTVFSFLGLDVPNKPTVEELVRLVGVPVTIKIFTSTSFDNLGLRGRDTEIWLTVPAGYRGCQYIQSVALPQYKHQEEILFARGLKLKITGAKIENGKYVLNMEVLK